MKFLPNTTMLKFVRNHKVFFISYTMVLIGFYFMTQPFNSKVMIHVDVPRKIFLKIFWGQDSLKFQNANSSGKLFSKHTNVRTIRAGNLRRIRYLRIDPLQRKGTLTIKKIEIRQPGFEPIIFETKKDFDAFTPVHHIKNLELQPNAIRITSSGGDPHLRLEIEPRFNANLLSKYIVTVLFNAFFFSAIIYGFYRWIGFVGSSMEAGRPKNIFLVTIITLAIVRFIFIVSYPLNSAGDGHSYYRMITGWHASLAFAGGYPFLFGLMKPVFISLKTLNADFFFPRYLLLVTQHLVDLGLLVLLYFTLNKVFFSGVACLSLLFYGLNPFIIGNVSTTRPEWFQSILFAASLAVAFLGYLSLNKQKKIFLYVGSSLIFCLAFFVKFNLLPLCLAFVFFIVLDKSSYQTKLQILVGIAVSCSVFYTLYVFVYQKPSTGTTVLTHDRSWILMRRANAFFSDRNLSINNGIYTKRFKVLTWYLKQHGRPGGLHPPTLYSHVNAVTEQVRKIYRNKYGHLLRAEEQELNQIIKENPEIKSHFGNQLLISYYIGTQESDELGTKVFYEAVMAEPTNYLKSAWNGFLNSFLIISKANNFPLNQKLGWGILQRPKAVNLETHMTKKGKLGFSLIRTKRSRSIHYKRSILWVPGVNFFSVLSQIFNYWILFGWLSGLVVTSRCIFARIKMGSWSQKTFVPVVMTGLVLFFVFWSNMVYRFRESKELILIIPYLCIFSGLLLRYVYDLARPKQKVSAKKILASDNI